MNAKQTKTNVLKLRRPFQMFVKEIATYEGRKKIAALLRNWERQGKENTYRRFALNVGLSPVTVSRFASDETHHPRIETIMLIMHGLDFRLVTFYYDEVVRK